MTKSKVQSILPLLKNQEILLMNHLLTKKDEGQIIVQATINGIVDVELFEESLKRLAQQEEVFRMSIQWENLSKKILVIQTEATLPFTYLDWRDEQQHSIKMNDLFEQLKTEKFVLSKAPLSQFYLIQLNDETYKLIWNCHHILFDGISSRIALKKLADIYNGQSDFASQTHNTVNWKKVITIINDKPYQRNAKQFWNRQLDQLLAPSFLHNRNTNFSQISYHKKALKVPRSSVIEFLKEEGITLNTWVQSIVLILLSKLQNSDDVVIGTVVSGRAIDGVDLSGFIGMLANIVPLIHTVKKDLSFIDFAKQVQLHHARSREFENYSIQQLFEDHQWTGNRNLFDCLLVVENFKNEKIKSSTFEIDSVTSNLTSNYPLTITLLPKDDIEIQIRTTNLVSEEVTLWISQNLNLLVECVQANPNLSVKELIGELDDNKSSIDKTNEIKKNEQQITISKTASNQSELKLTQIWESVLQYNPIGIHDHFFEMGGKSIQAVSIFSLIEKEFGKRLNPSILLNNPTIHQLAKLVENDFTEQWKSLVPLKTIGDLAPIFCIHAGGAHVFGYNEFTKLVEKNRPVYALQPLGLDGETEPHQNIKEMASYYINEIKSVQPKGPIHIMGHCFSGAVALEMGRQLKDSGTLGELIILDSAVFSYFLKEYDYEPSMGLRWRFVKKILKGRFSEVYEILKIRGNDFKRKRLSDSATRSLEKLSIHMSNIYLEYQWEPIDHSIHLITSTEFASREDKLHHIKGWNAMSHNQMTNQIIEGEHQQVLKQPAVKGLAKAVELILNPNVKLSFVKDQVNSEIRTT